MNLRNVWHLGIKELRGLKRDTAMLVLIAYAFSISIYASTSAIPDALSNAAIAIVDEDQSHLSSRVSSAFYPPYFTPPNMIGMAEIDPRMDTGLDTFALNIPPDFERDALAGETPQIQLNIDATRMSQAFTGAGYIQQIVTHEVSEFMAGYRDGVAPPVELTLRARYNPSLDPAWFGAITGLIQAITMLSLVLTGAALIREKEHGTIEHLLAMPVTATEIMLSKIWSMGSVVLLGSAFAIIVVVQLLLSVPIAGSAALFLLGAALMLYAMTALGIFIATIAGTMPQFALLMILAMMPLHILSGSVTPRESMPEIVQTIMLAAPNTHFIILSQGILFRDAGIGTVWPQFLALAAIGTILFRLALGRFRRFLR